MKELKGYDYYRDEAGALKALNRDTGEITDAVETVLPVGTISYTPEQQERYKERKALENRAYLQRANNTELGHFYFANKGEPFNAVSPENVTRLIYLNTYANYDGVLMLTERTPMKKSDLPKVLGLSVATVSRFLKDVAPDYIMENGDGLILPNRDIFMRGTLDRKANRSMYQKIYIEAVQRLYKAVPIKNHRQLGYLFKLLPHINIEYNLICRNPDETELEKVELISLAEFCNMVGFDVAHIGKLLRIYSNLLFDVDGQMERFCAIAYDGIQKSNAKIIVNPHILYSGSDYRRVEILGVFCTE